MQKILLIFGLLSAHLCFAQEESLFDRINGVSFHNKLLLRWKIVPPATKGALYYRIDKEDEWYAVDDDLIFKVRNNHRNNFKVFLEFYNPLNYSVKSGVKDLDDPAYLAISEFISQLPTSGSTQTDPASDPKKFLFAGGATSTTFTQSMLLHQWILEFTLVIDDAALTAANSAAFNGLIDEVNKIKAADDYLFNKFPIGVPGIFNEENTVTGWIKRASDKLFVVGDDFTAFSTELALERKVYDKLQPMKQSSKDALKAVEKLLSVDYDVKIDKFIKAAYKENFKKYSLSTAMWLSLSHNDRFDLNDKAIDKFDTFLKGLEAHKDRFTENICDSRSLNCQQYAQDYDFTLKAKLKVMKSFEYNVVKLDRDGTELKDNNFKGTFIVGKKLFFYPYVSTGLLYTDFSYPNYAIATQDGVSSVARIDDTKVGVRPALFLNNILASWDPVYPFIQVGITTGDNDALFPVGGGLSFGSSFSISGGIMLGYRKSLTELEEGMPADDAALKGDLANKGMTSWYFSVNYNLGKK